MIACGARDSFVINVRRMFFHNVWTENSRVDILRYTAHSGYFTHRNSIIGEFVNCLIYRIRFVKSRW